METTLLTRSLITERVASSSCTAEISFWQSFIFWMWEFQEVTETQVAAAARMAAEAQQTAARMLQVSPVAAAAIKEMKAMPTVCQRRRTYRATRQTRVHVVITKLAAAPTVAAAATRANRSKT